MRAPSSGLSGITLRDYVLGDRARVAQLLGALDWCEVPVDWHLGTLERVADGAWGAAIVAEGATATEVIGFLSGEVHIWEGGGAQMYALVVAEGQRRRGVGTVLLEAFEMFALERGADWVDIDMPLGRNDAGRSFLERRGYEIVQERPAGTKMWGGVAMIDISGLTYRSELVARKA